MAQTYDNGVSVQFTGDACVYSGPTEFTVGDRFDITAVDATEGGSDVGYAVDKVVDGTTVADAQEAQGDLRWDGRHELSDGDSGTYLWSLWTAEDGTQRYMSATLDVAGTWLLYCFLPAGGTFKQVYATTFEVVE